MGWNDEHRRAAYYAIKEGLRIALVEKDHLLLAGDYMPYDRISYIASPPEYPGVHGSCVGPGMGNTHRQSSSQSSTAHQNQGVKQFGLHRLSHPLEKDEKNTNL